MIDLTNVEDVKAIQSNLHTTFDTPQGKEAMKFLEQLCNWYPTTLDTLETNEVIARDANRRVLGMIKTLLEQTADVIVSLATEKEE